MEAQHLPGSAPRPRRAQLAGILRDDEALIAAPAVTHAEDLHAVEHRLDGMLRVLLEDNAEEARGAGEVTLPEFVAGMPGKGGMEDALDLGPLLEPARQLQRL